jgi:hypothetical protein
MSDEVHTAKTRDLLDRRASELSTRYPHLAPYQIAEIAFAQVMSYEAGEDDAS